MDKRALVIIGAIAVVILAILAINESRRSKIDKAGDSIEEAAEDVADAINGD